jgi:hypothetical protein
MMVITQPLHDVRSFGLTYVVQLFSNVYELQAMDVIRVVADQREFVARLTVPHTPNITPFITIHCPRNLAMKFLTERQQVKW